MGKVGAKSALVPADDGRVTPIQGRVVMIDRLQSSSHARPAQAVREATPVRRVSSVSGDKPDAGIPSSPPQEVLDALDTAANVLRELAQRRVEMRFEFDERANQVHVEVRDGEGNVVRQIPATRALDILAGAGVDGLVVDAVG
jgi:flagellar protein FlaG